MSNLVLRVVGLLALIGTAAPASAALTARGIIEDNPRAAWLDRFQDSRRGPEQTERAEGTYRVGRDGALDLSNIAGDIRVSVGGAEEIRIESVKRVRSRDDAERASLLRDLRVEITHVADRVEVRTQYPRRSGRGVSARVDFTVQVPAGTRVALKSISGDVSVRDVQGAVRVESISGDVEVTSTPNLALAKTVSGNVTARDISAAALTLGAVSGDIIASGLTVRTLDAGTVSGNIRLTGLQGERVQAKSVSGDILYEAALNRGSRYEFGTHSGNVRLVLAGDAGFELDATSFSGSIRSDFPVTVGAIGRDDRRRSNNAIRGTYGDAGAVLSLRSFSGTIVISRK
ncbi:MAG: DUF4097 family beta strand repeat-containing protein [Acidobacteriota bacterium]